MFDLMLLLLILTLETLCHLKFLFSPINIELCKLKKKVGMAAPSSPPLPTLSLVTSGRALSPSPRHSVQPKKLPRLPKCT